MSEALATAGLDIVHPFDAREAARAAGLDMLAHPTLQRGLLIGNTRALWLPFRAAMPAGPDPLEHHIERAVATAFPGAPTWFSHRRYGGRFLPFQRLAVATGLGALAPTGLVIHPIYGPWFALRAIVLVEGDPVARAPIAKPCRCDGRCEAAVANARVANTRGAWLAVREACQLKAWRYSDDQIAFHYAGLASNP